MSLRLRLALWYGGLTALVVFAVASVAFVVHGRSLYDDIDRTLAEDASLVAPVLDIAGSPSFGLELPATGRATTFVRLYNADGYPLTLAGSDSPAPPIEPIEVLDAPESPAYPRMLRLLPGGGIAAVGSFVTVDTGEAPRTRVYVLPVREQGAVAGYVEAWSSLGGADGAIERFELMMVGLGVLSVVLVTGGSFAIGSLALQPVGSMIETADAIARSRDFRRRIPAPTTSGSDELARLARTLNEMLDTVEVSHVAQRRFVADAAHELRAPLTAIQGNLELLARVAELPAADRREIVAEIRAKSGRLERLVDELLLLARSDAGQRLRRQAVELDEVVLAAVAELGDVGHFTVETIEPCQVTGDPDRLHQVVAILLDNARRYSPAGSVIRVALLRDGEDAVVRVQDSGIGVEANDLPHVFERFFRGDRARAVDADGSGLGLAIARMIVEQHAGRIALESEPGVGTTAVVRVPLRSAETPPTSQSSGQSQHPLTSASATTDTVRSGS